MNDLQDAKDGYEEYLKAEALYKAIKALSQEPTFDDECQKDMDEVKEE